MINRSTTPPARTPSPSRTSSPSPRPPRLRRGPAARVAFSVAVALGAVVSACGDEFSMDAAAPVAVDGADASLGPDAARTGPGPTLDGATSGVRDAGPGPEDAGHPRARGDGGHVVVVPPQDGGPARVDGGVVDAGPVSCDQDGDGYLAVRCGGNDCCDLDDEVYPSPTNDFFTKPNGCGTYDYDCDGVITARYSTASTCKRNVFKCAGEGFETAVECGAEGAFATCATDHGKCTAREDVRTQGCR